MKKIHIILYLTKFRLYDNHTIIFRMQKEWIVLVLRHEEKKQWEPDLTSFISLLIYLKWSKRANFAKIFENVILYQFPQNWLNILIFKAFSLESPIVNESFLFSQRLFQWSIKHHFAALQHYSYYFAIHFHFVYLQWCFQHHH